MEMRNGLRHGDMVIALVCVALVLLTLGAVGQTGRGRAKEYVCQANLHRWGDVFGGIIEENDGRFSSGFVPGGYYWPLGLPPELQDWKRNRTWFCPTATVPQWNEQGISSGGMSIFNAWGIIQLRDADMRYKGEPIAVSENGLAGSYGLNGYVIPIEPWGLDVYPESPVPASNGWRDLQTLSSASAIPMFLDALRFDVWPLESHAPAAQENAAWGSNHMARCCINRHDGAVNCLFVDGSARKVGLKELWTLKWHKGFNTAGPWTKAGGVQPENWPEWIRPFKDY